MNSPVIRAETPGDIAAIRDVLAQRGVALSFVYGNPNYYRRYGYSTQEAAAFKTPYDGPHLMALRLSAAAPRDGEIAYPRAFAKLA